MSNSTKASRADRARTIISAASKHLDATVELNGTTYKRAAIIALVQATIDSGDASTAARKQFKLAVKQDTAANAAVKPVVKALKNMLIGVNGADSEVVAAFGFTPKTPAKPTVETKAAAVEQARQTRQAKKGKAAAGGTAAPGAK